MIGESGQRNVLKISLLPKRGISLSLVKKHIFLKQVVINIEHTCTRKKEMLIIIRYSGLAGFYNDISNLFQGGNLGGTRIIAQKPFN